jgi:hypothetical protein
MNIQAILIWGAALALVALGYQNWSWAGVALVVGGVIFWQLLHFTRMMQTLKRATSRPKGYVDSAIMLQVKLKSGMRLLEILALTRSLGESISGKPEIWRWTDTSGASVECEMNAGKLVRFQLKRRNK